MKMALCEFCGFFFVNDNQVFYHQSTECENTTRFECTACGQSFGDIDLLCRHERHTHSKKKRGNTVTCHLCDKVFSCKSALNRHTRETHSTEPESIYETAMCPLCKVSLQNIKCVDEHLKSVHEIHIEVEELLFPSQEEFYRWKQEMEIETSSHFIAKNKVAGGKRFYSCHRSGRTHGKGSTVRMQWKKSNKTGVSCPARISTYSVGSSIKVVWHKTHVGHETSIRYLQLKKEERAIVAKRIQEGVNYDRILDDIREMATTSSSVERIHLLERKDLHNIVNEFGINLTSYHRNDAMSTDLWVQDQKRLCEDDRCVILYKRQGQPDPENILQESDFMLVLMTKYQREEIAKFLPKKVLVDSTHGTTEYDFYLTTLLTVDNYGAGCPLAYCVSSRVDTSSMVQFFKSVKSKVGNIDSEVFMSDDTPVYLNAWTQIMGEPQNRLLCAWHVDRTWRNNIRTKVKTVIKQGEVYKGCRVLLESIDINEFQDSLRDFLAACNEDNDVRDFGEYFYRFYATRVEQWAFCYRLGLGINTNMYLEALHKKIKYCYMDGRHNRRVDKCIHMLLRLTRDMMFSRIIREMKNKPTKRMETIGASHRRSEKITSDMIAAIGDNVWEVKSSTPGREPYCVSISMVTNCQGCPLTCPDCKVCVHQFTCTCTDNLIRGNFCKHVHACVRAQLPVTTVVEGEVSSFEEHARNITVSSSSGSVDDAHIDAMKKLAKNTLDTMYEMFTRCPPEKMLQALRGLDSAKDLLHSQITNDGVEEAAQESEIDQFNRPECSSPANKRIATQRRFHSIRKSKPGGMRKFNKPTVIQKIALKECMTRRTLIINTSSEFDHTYAAASSE